MKLLGQKMLKEKNLRSATNELGWEELVGKTSSKERGDCNNVYIEIVAFVVNINTLNYILDLQTDDMALEMEHGND